MGQQTMRTARCGVLALCFVEALLSLAIDVSSRVMPVDMILERVITVQLFS